MPLDPVLLLTFALLGLPQGPAGAAPPQRVAVVQIRAQAGEGPNEVVSAFVGNRLVRLESRPAGDEAGDGENPPARRRGLANNLVAMPLARENFDELVFPKAWLPRVRQPHLHYLLDYKVDKLAEKRPLTEAERRQLLLAGTGDIQRFLDRVDAARRDFEVARLDFKSGVAELDRLDALGRDFRDGPFGAGSIFAKTLGRIDNGAR